MKKGKYRFWAFSVGCGLPSPDAIKNKTLNDSAQDLGYRSFSHIRTYGSIDDLLFFQSRALDAISDKLKQELSKQYQ